MVMLRNNDRQKKESPYMVMLRNNVQKNTYISNKKQLQNHSLTFILKNNSLLSATSILSRSPMGYNTTES